MAKRMIEVDEDVFVFLQRHGEPLVDTPNDVLRRLLLTDNPPAGGRPPGALTPLIERGLAKAGDRLTHEQPRRHRTHEAVITADGWVELPDGRAFSRPSPALKAQTGTPINGWIYIHTASGRMLHELRDEADRA